MWMIFIITTHILEKEGKYSIWNAKPLSPPPLGSSNRISVCHFYKKLRSITLQRLNTPVPRDNSAWEQATTYHSNIHHIQRERLTRCYSSSFQTFLFANSVYLKKHTHDGTGRWSIERNEPKQLRLFQQCILLYAVCGFWVHPGLNKQDFFGVWKACRSWLMWRWNENAIRNSRMQKYWSEMYI